MIRGSIHVAVVAALLSLVLHGFGLVGVTVREDQPSAVEEGAADLADVGATFEDFAALTPEPAEPEPAPAPDPPGVTPPEQAIEEIPTSRALVASDNPQDVTAPDTGTADVMEPDAAAPSDSDAPAPGPAERSGGEDISVADVAILEPVAPDTAAIAAEGTPDERPDPAGAEPPEQTGADPPDPAAAEPPDPTAAEPPEPGPEAAPVTSAETVSPLAPDPDPSPDPASIPEPDMPDPELPEMTAARAPADPETVTAEDPRDASSSAVTRSLRPPKERPLRLALGMPDAVQQQGARTGRATGTIESPLTNYQRTGVDPFAGGSSSARTTASGFAGARNPGNASTTNYAGQVLVQLNRFPAARPSAQGAAQVSFEIKPDGTVAWITILRSTGSQDIRHAAAAQIRRAAPFPPPPQGTSQRLVFTYQRR